MHPHIPASDITYLVVEPPLYGYLEVLTSQLEGEDDPGEVEESRPTPITLFDQSLVDDKRVHYIQATANRTRDMFVVDVTNGISWLRGESTVITNLVIMRFKVYQVDQIL
jgi:chondroitin sulfate proteoglycan 4